MSKQTIYIQPQTDRNRKFIPFCKFHFHPGVPKNYRQCEDRRCNHYVMLYLDGIPRTNQNNSSQGCLNGLVGLMEGI